jgi:hypothetical protein
MLYCEACSFNKKLFKNKANIDLSISTLRIFLDLIFLVIRKAIITIQAMIRGKQTTKFSMNEMEVTSGRYNFITIIRLRLSKAIMLSPILIFLLSFSS